MIGTNANSILQVKNILKYFDDMKHINVQHISLTNIPKTNDNYSCGVFVCLYSYFASFMINEDGYQTMNGVINFVLFQYYMIFTISEVLYMLSV